MVGQVGGYIKVAGDEEGGGREKESGKEINEIQSGTIGGRYWEGEIAREGETINPPCHLNRDQCVSCDRGRTLSIVIGTVIDL